MKRRWWAYYTINQPDRLLLLSPSKLTDKQASRQFRELPRHMNDGGIVPVVLGLNYLSSDNMDAITNSKRGVIQ